MSPWTALLESLHSALIDELTERHPEPKPTLGMPVRHSRLQLPKSSTDLMICEVTLSEKRAFALLAFEPSFMTELKTTPVELWSAILRRAGSEFMRRNIRPLVGNPREFRNGEELPPGYAEPARVIWIPFEIPAGICFLGLGV